MIRVLINNQEPVNQPIGISELKERFAYSQDLFGFTREIMGNLTFYGDDFTFFWDLFRTGDCSEVTVDIQEKDGENGQWYGIWFGLIYIRDITFDADRRTAQCEIIDNSFVAQILNYLDTPISLFTERTRGGEPISITPQSILVVDHNNVTQSGIVAYTLVDLLDYFTRWITDNNVTVVSNYLSAAPFDEYYFVRGTDLRQLGGVNTLLVTFGDLLRDVCRLFNTRWVIQTNQNGNVLRLENVEFFEDSPFIDVEGFKEFKVTNNDDLDYTTFAFGSHRATVTGFEDSDTWAIRALIPPFSGYAESVISPDGVCQSKTELSLRTRAICYDSNTISKVRNNTTDAEFDDMLFIVTDAGAAWYNIESRPINNFELLCVNQLKRWLKSYCFAYPTQIQGNDAFHTFNPSLDGAIISTPGYITLSDVVLSSPVFNNIDIFAFSTVSLEIYFEIFCDPADNPLGAVGGNLQLSISDTSLNPIFLAPFTGWTNGTLIPGTIPPLYDVVNYAYTNGETFVYQALIHNVTIEQDLSIRGVTFLADADIVKLTSNSYIKIRNNSYQAFDGSPCIYQRFKVSSEGFLPFTKAKEIRDSRFGNILLPNAFVNFTGNISTLERNLVDKKTQLTINAKNV